MGNTGSGQERLFIKRNESFGSKSPRRTVVSRANHSAGGAGAQPTSVTVLLKNAGDSDFHSHFQRNGGGLFSPGAQKHRHNGSLSLSQRSHSLEQSGGTHSPSSSRSSSSNSYINSILQQQSAASGAAGATPADRSCLRQSTEPKFQISGDLNPHQIALVKRAWKQALKTAGNDDNEVATRLLLRIFQLDPRLLVFFSLKDIPLSELRLSPLFANHVKAFEPTLVHVMTHLTNATALSKHLQQLGGRHVNHTGVTYKSSYWKCFTQALVDLFLEQASNVDQHDALNVLGDFCVEQMRIGYRIEYKLQCEAERLAHARRKRQELSKQPTSRRD